MARVRMVENCIGNLANYPYIWYSKKSSPRDFFPPKWAMLGTIFMKAFGKKVFDFVCSMPMLLVIVGFAVAMTIKTFVDMYKTGTH